MGRLKPWLDSALALFGRGPVMWNPWNKVVQDHRDGTIHRRRTNRERARRGLPVPWTPRMAEAECHEPAIR
jgi:hypothetical protein